ncbi:hypothetical protein KQH82_00195 [bacterium]|nr:hypothetical protein [bacterium]
MKSLLSPICVVICLILFSLSPIMSAQLHAAQHATPAFVDLDGDGFDDTADDTDSDGIPDAVETAPRPKIIAVAEPGAAFFSELTAEAAIEAHLSVAQQFKLRENAVRDITSCRSDLVRTFDDSGEPGANLTGGGGNCVGGICF